MQKVKNFLAEYKVKRQINKFIKDLTSRCNDEIFISWYKLVDGAYMVWHNREDLESENEPFMDVASELIGKYFYDKDIWNIVFGYDKKKAEEHSINFNV
jgi:hypothetical protein